VVAARPLTCVSLLGSAGEHQLAFASFQRAIDLNPEDRYTYFKLGMMYEQLGEWALPPVSASCFIAS
jgi:Flp pilus assembly protein TadD